MEAQVYLTVIFKVLLVFCISNTLSFRNFFNDQQTKSLPKILTVKPIDNIWVKLVDVPPISPCLYNHNIWCHDLCLAQGFVRSRCEQGDCHCANRPKHLDLHKKPKL
ncbi:hypothetical protein CHUAL_010001 [Chamberlinius hualienensis]